MLYTSYTELSKNITKFASFLNTHFHDSEVIERASETPNNLQTVKGNWQVQVMNKTYGSDDKLNLYLYQKETTASL